LTDLTQHFFSERIINKWNTLHVSKGTGSAPSLNIFEEKLQRLYNDGSMVIYFSSLHDPPGRASSLGRPNPVSYLITLTQFLTPHWSPQMATACGRHISGAGSHLTLMFLSALMQ